MIDYSFEDMDRDPVDPGDPVVMEMMYKSGTKPGEDRGTPEEKRAYAEYHAKRESGVQYETLRDAV